MSRLVLKWTLYDIVQMIIATLLNKYDFFIVVEGATGVGKSTIAFHIVSKVSQEFKRLYSLNEERISYYYERIGRKMGLSEEEFVQKILDLKSKKAYKFHPASALIYTQDALLKSLASWNSVSIPDELINITFNRDFYSEKQKDIIKMLNMFRDHENLTVACVPQFQVLDNQIKNLCKMKITVKKRGVAIIHTPNAVIYCKDKWDQATNEKIEREWIIRKIMHPNYSKLTTFRGMVKFPPLSRKQEAMYQEIKNKKRATVLKDEMHIDVNSEDNDPYKKLMKRLINGGIKNSGYVEGTAMAMGMTYSALVNKISKELSALNMPTALSHYYWSKKGKSEAITEEQQDKNVPALVGL